MIRSKEGIAKLIFTAAILFASSGAYANEAAVHTLGGGALLEQVFAALSKIFYGDSSNSFDATFKFLIRLCLTIGAFCCICLAFFRQRFEPLIRSFLLPALGIVALILLPRTKLTIKDEREPDKTIRVKNVPTLFRHFAVYTSELSYRLKDHLANALGNSHESWIEKIQTEENPFRLNRFPIQDSQLERNLHAFCRECVFYDLGLGLYTREELRASGDLLSFFQNKSSLRRVLSLENRQISCQRAIGEMAPHLQEAAKSCKPAFLNKHSEEEIVQRVILDALREELLKETPKPASIASHIVSLLYEMRRYLEALLYLAFPIAALLSLASFGFKMLLQWIRLVLWLSIWPVLYPVADLFLQSIWNERSVVATFGSILKLYDLYNYLEWIACMALVSIPLLSWVLIRAGLSRIVQATASFGAMSSEKETGKTLQQNARPLSGAILREASQVKQTTDALPMPFSTSTTRQNDRPQ